MKKYYTYELIDPRNDKVFYVGKGKHKRMYYHYSTVKNGNNLYNGKLNNKLKKLIKENLKPIYKKVFETDIEQEAFNKEIELIKFYGRETLCNLTEGGTGSILCARLGGLTARKKRKENPILARNFSIKITNALIQSYQNGTRKRKNVCDWTGKHHSIETIKKIRNSKKGQGAGENNSQFGTCWITNGIENRKILKIAIIPEGYKRGRKF
jgi:hypothetical protein